MFPFLFLSQLNSPNSSSYLRFPESNCQKGTVCVETCVETWPLSSQWSRFQHSVSKSTVLGFQDWLFLQKSCYRLVSGVPTEANLMHNSPSSVLLALAGAEMEVGGHMEAKSTDLATLPQAGWNRAVAQGALALLPASFFFPRLLSRAFGCTG